MIATSNSRAVRTEVALIPPSQKVRLLPLQPFAAAALATILLVGCTDSYWVRRASVAYTYAEAVWEKECYVPAPAYRPKNCTARKDQLKADYAELVRAIDTTSINGKVTARAEPLPKQSRQALEGIAKRWE